MAKILEYIQVDADDLKPYGIYWIHLRNKRRLNKEYKAYCSLCGLFVPPEYHWSGPVGGIANDAVLNCFEAAGYTLLLKNWL